ncbi:low affinity iron permease family protein [Geomonas subterranea]|uniref:Low affinity iron permease family protein n=1 Tax=Geomonas subterranea TaxID=2847989 RepID=A0ABX8LFQ0_9BACT|nr:low affinity iron permease family protein [Geomonas subterranea]QXE89485.1 low affinity iron permease family protein [Geomonas subterranea]QXM08400.1 low affinity iron permease family protein [Geomonas subterranea]
MEHHMSRFSRFATWASHTSGHPSSFIFALAIIVVWAVTGPIFKFSDTWQLVINTGTTIITFLMVFVIQNTQNRDSAATQLKLDEIIRSLQGANNALLNMEELDEKDLETIRESYLKLAEDARNSLRKGRKQKAATPPSV